MIKSIIHDLYGTIGNWDLEELQKEHTFDECWVCYESRCYEGYGLIVLRTGDKYEYSDISHCSCYGPFNHLMKMSITLNDMEVLASRKTDDDESKWWNAILTEINNVKSSCN